MCRRFLAEQFFVNSFVVLTVALFFLFFFAKTEIAKNYLSIEIAPVTSQLTLLTASTLLTRRRFFITWKPEHHFL